MNEKEFKKLKVGDKVRIVSKRPDSNNWCSYMDKWLGKVMTLRDTSFASSVRMMEDSGENWCHQGWNWYPEMIAEKVECPPTIVEHLIRGNKTIVKLSNGKVGVAKCSPEDEFDYYEGLRLATARAYGKDVIPNAQFVKEVKRPAEVGEYIKIVKPWSFSYGFYKKDDILKVYKIDKQGIYHIGVYCELKNKTKDCYNDEGNIIILNNEYVVLEGYTPEKKEETMRPAGDAMMSCVEAISALAKAFGTEVKDVKEVKRPAEVGEYIKIINAGQAHGCYANGDILKVYAFEYSEITGKRRGVFCNTKLRLPYDTPITNNEGNPVIFDTEYVVLENYNTEVKEVKRKAKVGEYVKIIKAEMTAGKYKDGDILKVIDNSKYPDMVGCLTFGGRVPVLDREYVVLEGYEPEEKKEESEKKDTEVKEVKRQAKVGDYIKIVNSSANAGCYSNGDILKVYKIYSKRFNGGGVFCKNKLRLPKDTPIVNDDGNILIKNEEYVVLENYKPEEDK